MAQNVNSTAPNLLTVASNHATVDNCPGYPGKLVRLHQDIVDLLDSTVIHFVHFLFGMM